MKHHAYHQGGVCQTQQIMYKESDNPKLIAWHKECNSAQSKMPTARELCTRLSVGHMKNNSTQETYPL